MGLFRDVFFYFLTLRFAPSPLKVSVAHDW